MISFLFLLVKISKNGKSKLFEIEIINSVVPIFTKQILSLTYRFQHKLGRSEFSISVIKMPAKTGARIEWLHHLFLHML